MAVVGTNENQFNKIVDLQSIFQMKTTIFSHIGIKLEMKSFNKFSLNFNILSLDLLW